jgi:hypothetical protein
MMRSRFVLLTTFFLASCGVGGPLTTHLSGTSPVPAPDAFTCARQQLKTIGFSQTSYDTDELRLTARKNDETVHRPDVNFRRLVDRLEIQVSPGSDGAMTNISVDAKTFAELTTHRGPTEEQEKTSETARAAGQTLLQKCSAPSDSVASKDSLPQ